MFHKIASYPFAEVGSLAYVEHVPLLILEPIYSRICGKSFQL
jgi:hypothetical protein